MNSKVYIVQKVASQDYSDLDRFGSIRFVTFGSCFPDTAEIHSDQVISNFNEMTSDMDKFDPDNDYLALNGDLVNVAILAAVISRRFGKVNLLKYSNRDKSYYPVVVNVP